jgi:HlyD family secretion protein
MASGLQGKAELDSVSLLVAVVLMWLGGGSATDMDIDRPDLKRRRRRQRWALAVLGLLSLAGVTLGLSRLQPAAPRVDRAQVWTDSVRRGDMLRQVRGNGSLVPEQIQYVQADTEGRIERILVLPGAAVEPETILMELSNPELEQEAFDLEWQLKAAEAGLKNIEVRLESERLAQESVVATLKADHTLALLEAEANETLARDGLVAALDVKRARAKADELHARLQVEQRRLAILDESDQAQLAVQGADLAKLRASLDLKRRRVTGLGVRARLSGVLQQIGDAEPLQVGQRIGPGTTLAMIVQPTRLKAQIKIAETQARDVQIGQSASIDTRNGLIPGEVVRVDPSVQNGTVTVDVALRGDLPKGARPDLSVDGIILIERLEDVLHVGRPVHGQSESRVGLFKVVPDRGEAVRVAVLLGRSSVSTIEVVEGLEAGDEVILSDMSQWEEFDRVRLD